MTECESEHERELREQWQEAHTIVHAQEQRARDLAFTEINRRLDEMNEMRKQIDNERGEFLRREIYDREYAALRDILLSRIDGLRDTDDARLKELENTKSNLEGRMWGIGAMAAFLSIITNLIIRYWGR